MSIQCRKCGTVCSDASLFCTNCGASLSNDNRGVAFERPKLHDSSSSIFENTELQLPLEYKWSLILAHLQYPFFLVIMMFVIYFDTSVSNLELKDILNGICALVWIVLSHIIAIVSISLAFSYPRGKKMQIFLNSLHIITMWILIIFAGVLSVAYM